MYNDEKMGLQTLLENTERRLETSHRICIQQEIAIVQARKDVEFNANIAKAAQEEYREMQKALHKSVRERKDDRNKGIAILIIYHLVILLTAHLITG